MDLLHRLVNAADVSAGRLTALLGIYWGSGGVFAGVATLLGAFPDGWTPGLYTVSVIAIIIACFLAAARGVRLPAGVYLALVILGAMAICLLVLWAGSNRLGVSGILFVYVTTFTFVTFRDRALLLVVVAAAMHLAVLTYLQADGGWAIWSMTWGVSIIAGVVVGEVVEASRRALTERDEAVSQLQRADSTKTALLHAVHHELSRPMSSMEGLAQTVADRGTELSDDARQELMERVVAASARLRETLDELVGVTRLSTGEVRLDLEDLPLREVVTLALDRAEVDGERIEVETPAAIMVRADRGRLAHALANLVVNAARYGGSDGPIVVESRELGEQVEIRVADHGPGIPDEVKEAVFEPFVRAKDSDVGKGTGIGLSLVRQFVRLHGGETWMEDRQGGGNVAVIRFPREGPAGALGESDGGGSRDHLDRGDGVRADGSS